MTPIAIVWEAALHGRCEDGPIIVLVDEPAPGRLAYTVLSHTGRVAAGIRTTDRQEATRLVEQLQRSTAATDAIVRTWEREQLRQLDFYPPTLARSSR